MELVYAYTSFEETAQKRCEAVILFYLDCNLMRKLNGKAVLIEGATRFNIHIRAFEANILWVGEPHQSKTNRQKEWAA